jgi:hypothetical protein
MSQQSSDMPTDEIEHATRPRKRRHGRFEIWMLYKKRDEPPYRWRRYETRELAEQNLAKLQRELGSVRDFEIRELK